MSEAEVSEALLPDMTSMEPVVFSQDHAASGVSQEQPVRATDSDIPIQRSKHVPTEKDHEDWFTSSLAKKGTELTLSFTSRRVQVSGKVCGHLVPDITVDTASDAPCISLTFLRSHPKLRTVRIKRVPPSRVSLYAANGTQLVITGFVSIPITLGTVTRRIDMLVIPSLGPDQLLLDNAVMTKFGAILDWRNQSLRFHSSATCIPATHKIADSVSSITVAAIQATAAEQEVRLRDSTELRAGHGCLVRAFASPKPVVDSEVMVEPRILSKDDFIDGTSNPLFEQIIVARTLATWKASDGSVDVQVCNPSSEHVVLPAEMVIDRLSPVNVTTREATHVHAIVH